MRVFDAELAQPAIEGISIGSTLTDLLVIEFINDCREWGIAQPWLDRLRWWRRYLHNPNRPKDELRVRPGQVLVISRASSARFDNLVMPVLKALSPDRCILLYQNPQVLQGLLCGVEAVNLLQAVAHDRRRWYSSFRKCWPKWRARVRVLAASLGMPRGAMERIGLTIIVNSQQAIGALQFLESCRPAAIVTDHDRARLPSCVVLAARTLGIPTFTLQHGVLNEHAVGYVPVIANRMFCWGELHRRVMIEAGENPGKLAIGGCPRLSRELCADPTVVRSRLGIATSQRVVMLGTSPMPPSRLKLLAKWFCAAVSQLDGVSGIVRLHPSERLDFYAEIAREHPEIRFTNNTHMSLDESLAASDVVVVHCSGLGGDALVKRRLTAVVEIPDVPLGHGTELVEQAGCPKAATAEELAAALDRMLHDADYRAQLSAAAERFVARFCAYFGEDSAQRIAGSIREAVAQREAVAT